MDRKLSRKFLLFSIILFIGAGILLLLARIVDQPLILLFLSKVGLLIGGGGTVAIWGLRIFFGEDHADALLINLIILGITFIILLIVGEVTVRLVFRNITTTGDNTSYFAMRWNKRNVNLNSWGFREREFRLTKPDDVYRLAVIGDSFTFGQGIAEDDRFTNLLEKYLNKKNKGYEVLNFGRPGAETIDHFAILRDVVLKTNPDFILLQWYINDFEGHDKSGRPKPMPLLPSYTLRTVLYPSSALYYLINQQWNSLQETLVFSGRYADYMYKRFGDPKGPESLKYIQSLKDFIDLCKNQKIPLGIVLFPDLDPDVGKAYTYNYLHKRVLEICTQEDITCLDLRSTFAGYTGYKKLLVNRFDAHPNPLANRLAAERIAETFGQFWLSNGKDSKRQTRVSTE